MSAPGLCTWHFSGGSRFLWLRVVVGNLGGFWGAWASRTCDFSEYVFCAIQMYLAIFWASKFVWFR